METSLIPIGDHCATSLLLRKMGLRKKAYPFDWVMSSDVDYNIISLFLQLINELVTTKNPIEVTNKYIGDLSIPSYTNSIGVAFPHESETDIERIKEKYVRRFTRLLTDIENTKCIFIICTRFTQLTEHDLNLMTILLEKNKSNKFLILSGVSQPSIPICHPHMYIRVFPYDRKDFYGFDYSVFRPMIESKLGELIKMLDT